MTRKRAGSFPVCCLLLLLIFGAVPVTHAAAGTAAVCALVTDTALGLDQAPVTALLETRLAQETGITLVDRGDIARVLHEQTLARLFGPEDGKERIATGRILKADLLILLQAGEREVTPTQKSRFMNIVISETAGGLRLLVRTVPWTANVEVDAAALQAVVRQGLRKSTEKITAICAVPPLVSNDLTHDEDYLQNNFARLLEQRVLEQPGIVAVELNEARAIASEYALSATGAQVVRPLPFYLYGEYRHDGVADARRMTVSLALRQGERQLQQVGTAGLRPEEAGPYLLKATGSLLNGIAGQSTAAIPTGDEARQLTERAQVFFQISNWEEALALYQASLLLKPDQPQALYNAALAASHIAFANGYVMGGVDKLIPKAAIVLRQYKLAREYLDAYQQLAQVKHDLFYGNKFTDIASSFSYMTAEIFHHKNDLGMRETIAQYSASLKLERDRVYQEAEQAESAHLFLSDIFELMRAITTIAKNELPYTSESKRVLYAEKLRAIRAYAVLLNIPVDKRLYTNFNDDLKKQTLHEMALAGLSQDDFISPEYTAFLDHLATVGQVLIPAVVAELRHPITIPASPTEKTTNHPVKTNPDIQDILFTPIELTLTNPYPRERLNKYIYSYNWLPCGAGTDLLWMGDDLLLLYEKGKLKRIFDDIRYNHNFSGLCYDGKYIWAPANKHVIASDGRHTFEPFLLVSDPVSGQQWQFTARDGLPQAESFVSTTIAPGKICLVGASDRTWCAVLTLSPRGELSVDILLEARQQPLYIPGKPESVVNPDLAFKPSFVFCLPTHIPGDAIRLLVGRDILHRSAPPLLIDPQTRKVEVTEEAIRYTVSASIVMYDEAIYFAEIGHGQLGIQSIKLGEMHKKPLGLYVDYHEQGNFVITGNNLHWISNIGNEWLTAKNVQAPFIKLRCELPGLTMAHGHFSIISSQVYGLLLTDGLTGYAVSFPHGLPKSQPTAAP